MEQLLDLFLELVGLFLPQVLDPWAVVGERRRREAGGQNAVVDEVQLEFEEQQVGGDVGQLLLGIAIELRAHRVGGVAGI